jgi:hypothetical protein
MFGPSGNGESYATGICSGSVAGFTRRGLWTASGWDSRAQTLQAIHGVVPDAYTSVTVELRGGGRRAVPVIGGVFVAGWTGLGVLRSEPVSRVTAIELRSSTGKLESWPFSVGQ